MDNAEFEKTNCIECMNWQFDLHKIDVYVAY